LPKEVRYKRKAKAINKRLGIEEIKQKPNQEV
jgi:hypothetical protein